MSLLDLLKIRLFGAPMPSGDMPVIRQNTDISDNSNDLLKSGGFSDGSDEIENSVSLDMPVDAKNEATAMEIASGLKTPCEKWPEKALFVCSGNICRSAYGAAKLRQLADAAGREIRIASCGILRLVGRKAAPEMIAAAHEHGLDLDPHRSSAISRPLVDASDVIFAMEPLHKKEICRINPEAANKTILLGMYLSHPSAIIPDPMGRAPQAYRMAADQIDEALVNWIRSFPSP